MQDTNKKCLLTGIIQRIRRYRVPIYKTTIDIEFAIYDSRLVTKPTAYIIDGVFLR